MRIKKIYKVLGVRVVLAVFMAMIAAASFGSFIFTHPVFADTASWASPNTITWGGITWTEISTSGNDMTLGGQDYVCGPGKMVINNYQSTSPATGTVTLPNKLPCGSNPPQTVQLTLTNTWQSVGGVPGSPSGSPSADTCPIDESSALRWVLCPVFDIGFKALNWMVGAINSFLYTPTQQIFGPTGTVQVGGGAPGTQVTENPDMQSAFNSFRNIALGFLVIAGLAMVIAQAANLEIFAAYTVRKALPRIVIAAIGVSLAWPILDFVVTFFDDLGVWTGTIILTVTHVSTGTSGGIEQVSQTLLGALMAGFVGVGAFVIMGAGGILPLIGTLLLAALVGLIVLAVRQLVILMCIILAPLAIAASVLPGTYKLWDFWEDTFTGALLMYPLIMGFLTAGMAMAGIAGAAGAAQRANNGGSGAVWDLLALLAYFAPFFFLPFMFRIAGGLMGGVHSMVNGKFQGGFKQLSEKRQQATAINKQKLLEGRRKMLPKSINAIGKHVGAFQSTEDKLGFLTSKASRDIAVARFGKITQGKYAHEDGTGATQYWDDMLHAQKYRSAADARANLAAERGWSTDRINTAIRQAEAQGGFGFAQQQYAAEQLAANGTGYDNMGDALRSIAIASNGNKQVISNMVGGVRSLTERAGRADIKGDFDQMSDIASAIADSGPLTALQDAGIAERIQRQTVKAARSFDNATLVRQKPKAVGNAIDALSSDLQRNLDIVNGKTQGDVGDASKEVGRIRAKLENMVGQATLGYGPEVNQEKINELMKSPEYDKLNRQMDNMMQPRPTQFTNPAGQVIQIRGQAYQPISVQPSPQAPQPSPTPATPGTGQPQPVMVQQQPGVYTQQQPVQLVNTQGQPIASQQQQQQANARPANSTAAQYWDYNSQRRVMGDRNDPRFPTLPGGDES